MNFTPGCASFEEVWLLWRMLGRTITAVSFSSPWGAQMSSTINTPYLAKYVKRFCPLHKCSSLISTYWAWLYAQVTGDTVYNLLRLADVACDHDERPLNPHKIRSAEVCFHFFSLFHVSHPYTDVETFCPQQVLHSPFDDIIPRDVKKGKKDKDKEEEKKSQSKATK